MQTAKSSADALLVLLNDILDFSKIESGTFRLEIEPFNLSELMHEIVKTLSLRANDKDLELTCELPESLGSHLEGDAYRLRQVITNLVDNAIKFTEHGEVAIKIELVSRIQDEVCLRFSVTDTGLGISEQDIHKIFAPFAQADASTTRHFGGAGLGLAISSELIQMMGGQLEAESTLGAGSRFFFTARFQPSAVAEGTPAALTEPLRGMPVLIVDDNATNLRIIEAALRRWSMEPTLASDAESALEILNEAADEGNPFPLAVLDALMPGVDGFTLVEQIKSDPRLAGATVLMISSAHRQTFRQRCEQLDIAAYLEKPIANDTLLEAVLYAVGSSGSDTMVRETPSPEPWEKPPLRILLAEDTPANQKVVTTILERRGHEVAVVDNGQLAVEAVTAQPFDVILMDVQMPIMDGFQATSAIRGIRPPSTARRIPIIAMTAHAMKGDRERCLAAGMNAYIAKPVDARKLIELIESCAAANDVRRTPTDSIRKTLAVFPGHLPVVPPKSKAELAKEAAEAKDQHSTVSPRSSVTKDEVAQGQSSSLIDLEGTMVRLEGDRKLLSDMIGFFESDQQELLERIETGGIQRDGPKLQRAAHSLKGLAANFGAQEVVDVAYQLELKGRDGNFSDVPTLLVRLKERVARLNQELRSLDI